MWSQTFSIGFFFLVWTYCFGPFTFQHETFPLHKARPIKTWFSQSGVEEPDWPVRSPDLTPIQHLRDEVERRLQARPYYPTSVPHVSNTLKAEWEKIPAARVQNLGESLPRRVETSGNILMPKVIKWHVQKVLGVHILLAM